MRNNNFFYVRNKKTGAVSRVAALPYMGQNSDWEEVEDPRPTAEAVKPKRGRKSKLPDADNADLSAGVSDAEDSS